tara:strand:+ start:308 stop:532 length:225 start_codon:yes stop_codon:yes gene_type:complete
MVNDLLRGMEMKQIEPDIEMQIYRNNIKQLQGQLQEALKRIKELTEELDTLKKQNNYERSKKVYAKLQTNRRKN